MIHLQFKQTFGAFHLDINLELPGHGVTAIFGPSGCGKTTLLRLVAGLERSVSGRVSIQEEIWQNEKISIPAHKRNLGYVFQSANLFPHLTVLQNIEYGRKRIAIAQRQGSLDEVIELLGIGQLLERRPANLSGGEQQRVSIARALAVNPSILLMDEPLAALDHARKKEIIPYLQNLQSVFKIPMLYVTHSPEEVAQLAHYLVVMENGCSVANGPIQEVLTRVDLPISLGEEPCAVFDSEVIEHDKIYHLHKLRIGNQMVWVREHSCVPGANVRVRILARDVSLSTSIIDNSSILNHLHAKVEQICADMHPAQALVHLRVDGEPLLARVTHRSLTTLGIEVGNMVWAQVKTMALLG